jgi:hypothetical protein
MAFFLLSLLVAGCAATPDSPLMRSLSAASASLLPHAAELATGGVKPILGHFLHSLHTQLSAFWATVPASEQAAAIAASTRPLGDTPSPMPGPYWRWVPIMQGYARPGLPLSFASPCFASTSALGSLSADGATYHLTLTASAPVNASCSDSYLLGSVDYLHVATFSSKEGSTANATLDFPVSLARAGSASWSARNGVLVMRFIDPEPLAIIYEALATVGLFIPALITSPITEADSASNYDFLARYANMSKPVRAVHNVTLDPALFNSGDILFIFRADGLASLESWGTGATTSHTVVFMRSEADGQLWVVESQSNGADWPIDRIQKNLWADWQEMAATASYGYVWLPMAPAARANFNVTAAWAYFNQTEGQNYGFQDFAPTFFDTPYDNLPWPARPEELEVVIAVLEGLIGFIQAESTPLLNLLFAQTLVQRLVAQGAANPGFNATFLQAVEAGVAAGTTFQDLLAAPEQDSYRYPEYTGSKAGGTAISLVCNAYACGLHKAAGSFGSIADSINCADTHNAVSGGAGVVGGEGARASLDKPLPLIKHTHTHTHTHTPSAAGCVPDEHL